MSSFFSSLSSFIPLGLRSADADFRAQMEEQMNRMLNPPVDPILQRTLDEIIRNTQTPPADVLTPFDSLITTLPEPVDALKEIGSTLLPATTLPTIPTILDTITLPAGPPPPYIPPIISIVEDIVIKDTVSSKVASAIPFAAMSLTALETASKIFTIVPFFLLGLIMSKEQVLQNINVEISAGPERKIYEIGFGKKGGEEVSLAIEVQAGRPLRYLYNKSARITDTVNPIFTAKNLLSYVPLLKYFVWKRQQPETECNITILDPSNSDLRNGPVVQYFQLSKDEGFNVIHQDPTRVRNLAQDYSASDSVETAESSGYACLSSVSVKVTDPISKAEKHNTQFVDLPFNDDDPAKADAYLRITQYS